MKERPILFSGSMVRAILEGRKTQTRRIIKPQPIPYSGAGDSKRKGHPWMPIGGVFKQSWRCPYGKPGDRLWVRETWAYEGTDGSSVLPIQYRADRSDWLECSKWKPSIYMHRAASRIDLEITGIRAEQIQEITEDDAKAEGVEPYAPDDGRYGAGYKSLWDSINGVGSWDVNPWVWVVEFRRVKP